MAVTWFYSLCMSCITTTRFFRFVVLFSVFCFCSNVTIYLFLPPACSSQSAAELCCPCVLAAGRNGQPSGPTSASGYHSPAAQWLPQLLGWQPRHSTQLVKNISCISRDLISNCWKFWNHTLFWNQHSNLYLHPPKHKVCLFPPLFSSFQFKKVFSCNKWVKKKRKGRGRGQGRKGWWCFCRNFFVSFFPLQVLYLIMISIFLLICNWHCRVPVYLVTSALFEHTGSWKAAFYLCINNMGLVSFLFHSVE